MRRFLIALLLLTLSPVVAYAQYYVCASNCAQGGANGSDASSSCSAGTISAPFATPQHAQAVMAACATKKTIIETGTYTLGSQWAFTSSDNNTTYVAYTGATPIISGGASPNTATNQTINAASGTTGMTFKGITFQNLGSIGGAGNDGGMRFQGSGAANANITLQYNHFTGCIDVCLTFQHVNGALVDSNTFDNSTSASIDKGDAVMGYFGAQNVTVSNNLCTNLFYACADFDNGNGDPSVDNITYDSNVVINACLGANPAGLNNQDCGALYMGNRNQNSTSMVIKNNVVAQSAYSVHDNNTDITNCIYLDDNVNAVTMTGNLCFNDFGQYAIHYHGNINTSATNNVFVLAPKESASGCPATGCTSAEIVWYQTQTQVAPNSTVMNGNTFTNNEIWFMGAQPAAGPYEVNGAPTNFLSVSGNTYYTALGQTFRNTGDGSGHMIDSSPTFCGPSMGVSPIGSISPVQLWGMLANGQISSWQQIRVNQGPKFRACSAGQF